jgi:uncharacterized protein
MSPEERQLIAGLFDRIQGSAATPRDPEAEALIANAVKAQPYAPYFLAQAVIVQNQALEAANKKIEDLQAQLQSGQPQGQPSGGGFLSSLGSIFGAPPAPPLPPEPPRPTRPLPGGPWDQPAQAYPPQPPQSYPPQGAAWGAPPMSGGGGFLSGALQSAAGVAGGVLLADSIRNLFGGHAGLGGLGMGTGFGGLGMGGLGGGETIVNNFYDDAGKLGDSGHGPDPADYFDDSNSPDFGGNDDGSFDV